MQKFSKDQIATTIALLFHTIGITGILFAKNDFFVRSTPINLLLSFLLLIWTQKEKNYAFYLFIVMAFFAGFAAEVVGVNTGLLFGDYNYGVVLGVKWQQTPLIIGINWVIIIYCCGVSVTALLAKITSGNTEYIPQRINKLKALSVITDGATLAVVFDWLMEPVAIQLNFWQWHNDYIPLFNYACWFFLSLLLLLLFDVCRFNKQNKFAVNLLLIQFLFFLLLRSFLFA